MTWPCARDAAWGSAAWFRCMVRCHAVAHQAAAVYETFEDSAHGAGHNILEPGLTRAKNARVGAAAQGRETERRSPGNLQAGAERQFGSSSIWVAFRQSTLVGKPSDNHWPGALPRRMKRNPQRLCNHSLVLPVSTPWTKTVAEIDELTYR